MDEPLSNLDAQLRVEMRREIRALQQRLGITMLYVTHDQLEAMTMADQVILMRAGLVEQEGSPAALYERPETTFAARFIGTPPMNVLSPTALAKVGNVLFAGAPSSHPRDALVLEDHIGFVSSATVCCNMDGTSKPFRMDIQAAREYRLYAGAGSEFRRR